MAGRKSKYYSHVQPYLPEIEKWCNTMTEAQICKRLGVGKSAFSEYKRTFPELAEAIKNGRRDLVSELRSALIKKAKGYEYTETKEVYEGDRLVKKEVTIKHASPDTASLNLALKNYDKEHWANDPQMLDIRKKELELKKKQVEANTW